nr:hypothetical protein CFP56_01426 [Quercus suber]
MPLGHELAMFHDLIMSRGSRPGLRLIPCRSRFDCLATVAAWPAFNSSPGVWKPAPVSTALGNSSYTGLHSLGNVFASRQQPAMAHRSVWFVEITHMSTWTGTPNSIPGHFSKRSCNITAVRHFRPETKWKLVSIWSMW